MLSGGRVRRAAAAAAVIAAVLVPSIGSIAPAEASPTDVTPSGQPPSAPGRLAYSTAVYTEYPDGSFSSAVDGLGTIGLDGSDHRVLTDPTGDGDVQQFDHSPTWSPDGSWLAYLQFRSTDSGGSDAVAVIPRDGGNPVVVDSDAWGPSWSPDGLRLAWASESGGIGIADVITTPTTITIVNKRYLSVDGTPGRPMFSPDGLTLAFSLGDYYADTARLFTMPVTGGTTTQITHAVTLDVGNDNYTWSPDGSRLLVLAHRPSMQGAPQAYVIQRDGSNQHRIGPDGDTVYEDAAVWSPAGDMVAFVTNSPRSGIHFVRPDGTFVKLVAENRFGAWGGLTYSPDGTQIFSVARRPDTGVNPSDTPPDLYAIPLDGSAPVRLTTDHAVFEGTVQAIDPGHVLRQFGTGAVETAAAAVTETVSSAPTVVLTDVADYAATLAVSPLAAKLRAPVLVTPAGRLPSAVRRAMTRLGTTHVVLAGHVSQAVADALRAGGRQVSRVADTDSIYRAAARIGRQVGHRHALLVPVVSGEAGAWRLPLASAGFAAFKRWPLLYTRHRSVPDATVNALRALGVTSVTLVGSDAIVRPALLQRLHRLGIDVHRVRSRSPYAVSARFAERWRESGGRITHPFVASGAGWSRSLAAPALAALTGQVSLLVDNRTLAESAATAAWLADHRRGIRTARLVGGVTTVRPRVEAQLERRV